MFQTFFLVVLPGIAPWGALGAACYFVAKWMNPKVQARLLKLRLSKNDVRHALYYRQAATPVISELFLQMDRDPELKEKLPDEMYRQVLSIVNKEKVDES